MLKLTNIVKDYNVGDETVHALKGISIEFRKSEFVAILGPSGCGKTTLLNIIGGLDQYTSGDLSINRRSTKMFKDSDWDSYRNHSIGFVFQSYNLIPHQSVLANVELALTLSGVGKAERRRRAVDALKKVGLGNQIHKRPNQMSGGQMQRVAIARALVNDPEILMADEPTGALDSQTSVQIMELLKEVSKDRLVIMVTHNPELAEQYATRIVRCLDGEIQSDSNPYTENAEELNPDEIRKVGKERKTSMSFFTALSLSLNNLLTKKGRTILTSFAGSIGIIGIALILSVSTGVQKYIDRVQEDTLASYPISIQAKEVDMSELLTTMMNHNSPSEESGHELDAVYENRVMYDMMKSMSNMETQENNLVKFKEFIESSQELRNYTSAISYSYDTDMKVYVTNADGKIVRSDILELISSLYAEMGVTASSSTLSSYMQLNAWQQLLSGMNGEIVNPLLKEQYDVVDGRWPERYDEIVVAVDDNNEISDMMLFALGLETIDSIKDGLREASMGKSESDEAKSSDDSVDEPSDAKSSDAETTDSKTTDTDASDSELKSWSYKDILDLDFRVILDCDKYQRSGNGYIDASVTDTGLKLLYDSDNAIKLKVVGIIRKSPNAVATFMNGAVGYTSALTDYIIDKTSESEIINRQKDNPEVDVLNGLKFKTDDNEITAEEIKATVDEWLENASAQEKSEVYTKLMSVPDSGYVLATVQQYRQGMTAEAIDDMLLNAMVEKTQMDPESVKGYLVSMDPGTKEGYVSQMLSAMVISQYAQKIQEQLGALSADAASGMLDAMELTQEQYKMIFDEKILQTRSDSTYDKNLGILGDVDKDSPNAIYIYAATFADKDNISDIISGYNDTVEEDDKISYTDYVKLLMSSITTIISAISYVLIAFVAISLVVSSIMIGIITYISVLERTKEIGILRAVGASKKDISRVFNAETLIVGFSAGAIGIGVTLLILLPINIILHKLTGISMLSAVLPVGGAVMLVVISMALTLIAGLIPSGIAAKKDPVVALRTE